MNYRAIVFHDSLSSLVKETSEGYSVAEGETPEDAMLKAVKACTYQNDHVWLRQATTWQVSTGTIFVDGKACGAVFKIMFI